MEEILPANQSLIVLDETYKSTDWRNFVDYVHKEYENSKALVGY